jgi:hypothetical protein
MSASMNNPVMIWGSSVEIQALCLRENRRIVFPCDDLREYNIARIRKSMDRVNEEPLQNSLISKVIQIGDAHTPRLKRP